MTSFIPSQSSRVWMTLLLAGAIVFHARADMLGERSSRLLDDVRNDGPNKVGMDLITQNYYEELLKPDDQVEWMPLRVVRRFVLRTLGVDLGRPWDDVDHDPETGRTMEFDTGFLGYGLRPNHETFHKGVTIRTNRWGHRDDKDYEKHPEPGVFRIAIVGASNSLGAGVEVEYIYAQRLERMLNETLPSISGYDRFEIVNLSVHGYHLLERVYVSRHIAPDFNPHLILMEVTMMDLRRNIRAPLGIRVHEGRDLGFDFVREIVRRSGAREGEPALRVEQRLQRFTDELAIGCFEELRQIQDEINIPIVPIVLRLEVDGVHRNLIQLASIAEHVGFEVLRIFDAYEGQTGSEMYIAVDDFHPTAKGHGLLTEEIYDKMLENQIIRSLLLGEERDRSRKPKSSEPVANSSADHAFGT